MYVHIHMCIYMYVCMYVFLCMQRSSALVGLRGGLLIDVCGDNDAGSSSRLNVVDG